MLRRVAYARIV